MTVVFQEGKRFWIETIHSTITIGNAAGIHDSAVLDLELPGIFVGGTITLGFGVDNDNMQAIGGFSMLDQGSTTILPGEFITGVVARISKQLGTAGNNVVNIVVTIFLRGRGP